jgi:tRNA-modifying protein YgfZ
MAAGIAPTLQSRKYKPSRISPAVVPIALPPPNLLEMTGADAVAFAHAQFGSDVRALAVGRWQWSAWLSAQGRVRALFRLLRLGDDRLLAVLDGASAATMRDGLARYVLRSKVKLQPHAAAAASGCWTAAGLPAGLAAPTGDAFSTSSDGAPNGVFALPLPHGAGWRWLVFGDAAAMAPSATIDAEVERWRSADIDAGIVALSEEQSERYLPSWLGLDRLGAVSVGKGCYPGQEIVARLHFRGGNKRWLHRLAFEAAALPARGSALRGEPGTTDGELVCAAWTGTSQGVALAILPRIPAGAPLRSPTAAGSFRVISPVHGTND